MTSTLGLGGLLAGKLPLGRLVPLGAVVWLMILAGLVLTRRTGVAVVTIAQVVLPLLVVIASIHVTRLLHDAVPSTVRTGVASGVGAISWIAFLPLALAFGIVSKQSGVHTASWLIIAATVFVGALLFAMALYGRAEPAAAPPEPALEKRSGERGHAWNLHGSGDLVSDLTCAEFVELVTAFLDGAHSTRSQNAASSTTCRTASAASATSTSSGRPFDRANCPRRASGRIGRP